MRIVYSVAAVEELTTRLASVADLGRDGLSPQEALARLSQNADEHRSSEGETTPLCATRSSHTSHTTTRSREGRSKRRGANAE